MSVNDGFSHRRRRLLRGALAIGGLALAGGSSRAVTARNPLLVGEPIERRIPATGEAVPVSGMGTYRTFNIDTGDAGALARMRTVLKRFVEGGGRVVDSSPMYGRSEAVIGRLAGELGVRDRLWLATKVWTRGRQSGIEQMQRSMNLLHADPLDLMQVHNLLDLETQMETLRRWKDEGRVRYIGITHYRSDRHDELARLIRVQPVDFVQFNYSVMERSAERRLLPACADNGVATLINEPFNKGRLFSEVSGRRLPSWAGEIGCHTWAQLCLKYLIGHPAVTAVIPATSNPEHAAENVAAGRGVVPDEALRRRIRESVASG